MDRILEAPYKKIRRDPIIETIRSMKRLILTYILLLIALFYFGSKGYDAMFLGDHDHAAANLLIAFGASVLLSSTLLKLKEGSGAPTKNSFKSASLLNQKEGSSKRGDGSGEDRADDPEGASPSKAWYNRQGMIMLTVGLISSLSLHFYNLVVYATYRGQTIEWERLLAPLTDDLLTLYAIIALELIAFLAIMAAVRRTAIKNGVW